MYRDGYLLVKVNLGVGNWGQAHPPCRDKLKKLIAEIYAKIREAGNFRELYSVYGTGAEFLRTEETGLSLLWHEMWKEPEFSEYGKYRWNHVLLQAVRQNKLILLGEKDCLPEIIDTLAVRIKEIYWQQGNTNPETECLQQELEQLEVEYGFVINNTQRSFPQAPCCVLDFTEAMPEGWQRLPRGSSWIDYTSSAEKRRRITGYGDRIEYISLVRYWENCRRRIVIPEYQNDW